MTETQQLATKSDLSDGRAELRKEFAELRQEIADGNSRIIKWMFILSVAHIVVMSGILFAFIKLYFHR